MKRMVVIGFGYVLAACSGEPNEPAGARNESRTAPVAIAPGSINATTAPDPMPTATATPPPQIPAAFLGEWNRTRDDCGTGRNDTRLRIEPDKIQFHESSGVVTAVAGSGRSITVRARYSGEGETWESSRSFELSADGQTLSAEGMQRIRCP